MTTLTSLLQRLDTQEINTHFTQVVLPRLATTIGKIEQRCGGIDTPYPYYEQAVHETDVKWRLFFILHCLVMDDEYALMMIPIECVRLSYLKSLRQGFYSLVMHTDWHLDSLITPFSLDVRIVPGHEMNRDILLLIAILNFGWR